MDNPVIKWIDENHQPQALEIVDKIFIGRTCKGVDCNKRILLQNPSVSRDHAVISRTTAHLKITDRSKNGTWVNNIRMTAGSTRDLKAGDIINIGETVFQMIYSGDVCPVETDTWSTEMTMVSKTELAVTNLVADVRGFTELSQTQNSSEVCTLILEIFNRFSIIVNDYKGTIKDYAGDAIFAFWDHQIALRHNQALLACPAALKQMQALKKLSDEMRPNYVGPENLSMGWGITTGKVTMTHYGSRAADLALVGDCINLAFRFSAMANKEMPHKVLICSQTAALVSENLIVKDLGNFSIRGRKGKERIFALA